MRVRPPLFIVMLTLWFALLQAMAPLLHAHLNGENAMDDGPHMHMVELSLQQEESGNTQHPFHWNIHAKKSAGMTFGLAPAITEQSWELPPVMPMLMIWLLPAILCLQALCSQQRILLPWPRWRRPSPVLHFSSPRAPPRS